MENIQFRRPPVRVFIIVVYYSIVSVAVTETFVMALTERLHIFSTKPWQITYRYQNGLYFVFYLYWISPCLAGCDLAVTYCTHSKCGFACV